MKRAPVVGHIGPQLDAEDPDRQATAGEVIGLLHDAFIAGHDSGYAECVRAVEKGATMGQLGDWLSEYEEHRRQKRRGPCPPPCAPGDGG